MWFVLLGVLFVACVLHVLIFLLVGCFVLSLDVLIDCLDIIVVLVFMFGVYIMVLMSCLFGWACGDCIC